MGTFAASLLGESLLSLAQPLVAVGKSIAETPSGSGTARPVLAAVGGGRHLISREDKNGARPVLEKRCERIR